MERRLKMLITMFYLVVVGFRQSSEARLLGSDIFVMGLRNPSILTPYLNGGEDLFSTTDKSPMASDNVLKVWDAETKQSPPAEENVLNVATKGSVRPSGNGMVEMQQLATSGNSPGVGHMQIYSSASKSKSPPVREKRILQSTPSPGDGN